MTEPDDFGIAPFATLAHVGDTTPAPQHRPFWTRWREAVSALTPTLGPAEPADPSDPTATHRFESLGAVRIGCRLELPPKGVPVRAGLVTTHGYAAPDPLEANANRFRSLASRGVAVLVVRVRGFAGSQLDTGDWAGGPDSLGWITRGFPAHGHKLDDMLGWSLPQGVADVACAARALRDWLATRARKGDDPTPALYLRGESFGGGLAVMAAAQTPHDWLTIDRLAIGLPTFGDWAWRLDDPRRMAFGSGAEMQTLLRSLGHDAAAEARDTLRICDAAVHARKVRATTLCKLALRDEVVPAPTAAAVFNALGTDPGCKWRFIVPQGHTEPSLALARRLAIYERCAADFLDPNHEPAASMERWEGLLEEGDRVPGRVSDQADVPLTGEQGGLFGAGASPDRAVAVLIAAYEHAGRTLDDLPYTPEWASLYAAVGEATGKREREVFHSLHNLRKAGKLPRLGRAASTPPRIDAEEEAQLRERVVGQVGSLGQRDRLPFTPEFDRLVLEFNSATGRELSPHDVWRLIAKLAK